MSLEQVVGLGVVVLASMSEADQRGSWASGEAHNNSRELKEGTENSISWYVILKMYSS